MSENIVAHPVTGQPVRREVNYVGLERTDLENKVNDAQAALDQHDQRAGELAQAVEAAQSALNEHQTQRGALESAHADAKSDVDEYDSIAASAPDSGSVAASSESTDEATAGEESVQGVDESEGLEPTEPATEPTEEPSSEAVEVPVTVVDNTTEVDPSDPNAY